jgi:two-component system chemotaxis response regulator CheB
VIVQHPQSAGPSKIRPEGVVIGASAGAVDALAAVLPALPVGYPLAIMVVVHIPADKDSFIAELFAQKCQLEVREAEDKEPIRGGVIYFAPPDYHLMVEKDKHLSLSKEERVHYSRPSIDVLFETAADAYGTSVIGIILTGSSCDGAMGLRAIHDAGGIALVERPERAQAPAMPQAAIDACPQSLSLSLEEIAAYLLRVTNAV